MSCRVWLAGTAVLALLQACAPDAAKKSKVTEAADDAGVGVHGDSKPNLVIDSAPISTTKDSATHSPDSATEDEEADAALEPDSAAPAPDTMRPDAAVALDSALIPDTANPTPDTAIPDTAKPDTNPALTAGLVASYAFDEASGTTTKDSSGNNHTATFVNAPTWSTGHDSGGLTFAGGLGSITNGQYLEIPVSTALNLPNTGGTLSAWINEANWDAQGQQSAIIRRPSHMNPAADGNWDLQSMQAGPGAPHYLGLNLGSENDTDICEGVTVIQPNQWTHVAATWDATNIYLYVNGVLDQTCARTKTVTYTDNNRPVWIGAHNGDNWDRYFGGILDNIRIYNRTLSAAEIQTIMNAPVTP